MARVLAPLALLVSAAALVVVLWVADLGVSVGDATAVTLADVAGDPERYEGRTVTIGGPIARTDYVSPADAEFALVLGDDAGGRVLVIPRARAVAPRRLTEGTRLRVTGAVRAPQASAAERNLSQGGLLASTGADALVLATAVERIRATPRSSPAAPHISRTAVRKVVRRPRRFDGGLVAVSGRAFRITSHGFVLAGDRRSIFVAGRAAAFRTVESGERIRVRGEVQRISRFRSDTIRHALDATPESRRPPRRVRLGRTPWKPGRPFLVLRGISGA